MRSLFRTHRYQDAFKLLAPTVCARDARGFERNTTMPLDFNGYIATDCWCGQRLWQRLLHSNVLYLSLLQEVQIRILRSGSATQMVINAHSLSTQSGTDCHSEK